VKERRKTYHGNKGLDPAIPGHLRLIAEGIKRERAPKIERGEPPLQRMPLSRRAEQAMRYLGPLVMED
jgi:hypothetical protein